MERGVKVFFCLILITFLFPTISSTTLNSEINKATFYAEEFETGNIDYARLIIHLSNVRQNLNEVFGATSTSHREILKQEQLKTVLGEPQEQTKWVWVEDQEQEKRLDYYVPVWDKIVFDGSKIQIRLSAYPSLFSQNQREILIYTLDFQIDFKRDKEDLDIEKKINEIKLLAETFNTKPTSRNAKELAKKAVNAEKIFQNYFRQNSKNCIDTMNNIFGSENKREEEEILTQAIDFYQEDTFEAIIRLDMCEECDWNWINLNFELDDRGRGKFNAFEGIEKERQAEIQELKENSFFEFENKIKNLVGNIKIQLQEGNYKEAIKMSNKLVLLNNAWNEKSNEVWEDVDRFFESKREEMTEREMQRYYEDYGWIKEEQEKREKMKALRQKKYDKRKKFYLELFSDYDKRQFYSTQVSFEKRLVEKFRKFGEEICNNNIDDNDDGLVDCYDSQCAGKICGRKQIDFKEESLQEHTVDLYCIQELCQQKEQESFEDEQFVCGNHICEQGEFQSCAEDCAVCPEHEAIECKGKVRFKGYDVNGCPLEPICLNDTDYCKSNEDCLKPLCGEAQCIENNCVLTKFEECEKEECVDGQKRLEDCRSREKIVSEICEQGIWKETGIFCEPYNICGNGVCDEDEGENSFGCPTDCKWVCGNGMCEPNENDKCDVDCNPEISTKKDYGEECESDNECIHNKCRVGRCSYGNARGEGCKENWQCESELCQDEKCLGNNAEGEECIGDIECASEICYNGICAGGAPASEICGNGFCDKHEKRGGLRPCPQDCEEHDEDEEPNNESEIITQSETETSEKGFGEECDVKSDCGNKNDVCSNGYCVLLPEIIEPVDEESKDSEQESEKSSEQENNKSEKEEAFLPAMAEVIRIIGNVLQENLNESKNITDDENQSEEIQDYEEEQDQEYAEDDKEEEWREQLKDECRERCETDCFNMIVMRCTEECVYKECGEQWTCDVDDLTRECERTCEDKEEEKIEQCEDGCYDGCVYGEEFSLEEFNKYEEQEQKEEKGVFFVGGGCRKENNREEAFIYFSGWGNPFEQIEYLKYKYYEGEGAEWCKQDIENLKLQRKEFEESFNQAFIKWFFEKYLANSVEDWESHVSGIFELYWENIEIQRELARRMNCLGINKLNNSDYNLIEIDYESDYGKVKYWEELKQVKLPEMDKKVTIISPYMKIWVFPGKEPLKNMLKQNMKDHIFPGPPEANLEKINGLSPNKREQLKQDEKLIKRIEEIYEKYGTDEEDIGEDVDFVVQIVDFNTSEILMNFYIQVDKKDIMKVEPMPYEEVPDADIRVEVSFDKIYEIIRLEEKNLRGAQIESPPWDKLSLNPISKMSEFTTKARIMAKAVGLMSSAKVYPEEAKEDGRFLLKLFFEKIMNT